MLDKTLYKNFLVKEILVTVKKMLRSSLRLTFSMTRSIPVNTFVCPSISSFINFCSRGHSHHCKCFVWCFLVNFLFFSCRDKSRQNNYVAEYFLNRSKIFLPFLAHLINSMQPHRNHQIWVIHKMLLLRPLKRNAGINGTGNLAVNLLGQTLLQFNPVK